MTETSKIYPFRVSVVLSLVLTFTYVGCLYMLRSTRVSSSVSRNNIEVVYMRSIVICVVTMMLLLITPTVIYLFGGSQTWISAVAALRVIVGLSQKHGRAVFSLISAVTTCNDILRVVLLTVVFFTGSVVEKFVLSLQLRPCNSWSGISANMGMINDRFMRFVSEVDINNIYNLRDYFIGPLTEEIVFRACLLAVSLPSQPSIKYLVFVTPLYFGIAHIHHAYNLYLEGVHSVSLVLFSTAFQFLYTYLFGVYAAFIFLRTGTVWSCVLAHTLCNMFSVPFLGRLPGPVWKTVVYYLFLVAGFVGFGFLLFPLTASSHAVMSWKHIKR